ncbi:MAG: Phosphatidylinositol 4-kinase alpha [Marteilia pararefringens]
MEFLRQLGDSESLESACLLLLGEEDAAAATSSSSAAPREVKARDFSSFLESKFTAVSNNSMLHFSTDHYSSSFAASLIILNMQVNSLRGSNSSNQNHAKISDLKGGENRVNQKHSGDSPVDSKVIESKDSKNQSSKDAKVGNASIRSTEDVKESKNQSSKDPKVVGNASIRSTEGVRESKNQSSKDPNSHNKPKSSGKELPEDVPEPNASKPLRTAANSDDTDELIRCSKRFIDIMRHTFEHHISSEELLSNDSHIFLLLQFILLTKIADRFSILRHHVVKCQFSIITQILKSSKSKNFQFFLGLFTSLFGIVLQMDPKSMLNPLDIFDYSKNSKFDQYDMYATYTSRLHFIFFALHNLRIKETYPKALKLHNSEIESLSTILTERKLLDAWLDIKFSVETNNIYPISMLLDFIFSMKMQYSLILPDFRHNADRMNSKIDTFLEQKELLNVTILYTRKYQYFVNHMSSKDLSSNFKDHLSASNKVSDGFPYNIAIMLDFLSNVINTKFSKTHILELIFSILKYLTKFYDVQVSDFQLSIVPNEGMKRGKKDATNTENDYQNFDPNFIFNLLNQISFLFKCLCLNSIKFFSRIIERFILIAHNQEKMIHRYVKLFFSILVLKSESFSTTEKKWIWDEITFVIDNKPASESLSFYVACRHIINAPLTNIPQTIIGILTNQIVKLKTSVKCFKKLQEDLGEIINEDIIFAFCNVAIKFFNNIIFSTENGGIISFSTPQSGKSLQDLRCLLEFIAKYEKYIDLDSSNKKLKLSQEQRVAFFTFLMNFAKCRFYLKKITDANISSLYLKHFSDLDLATFNMMPQYLPDIYRNYCELAPNARLFDKALGSLFMYLTTGELLNFKHGMMRNSAKFLRRQTTMFTSAYQDSLQTTQRYCPLISFEYIVKNSVYINSGNNECEQLLQNIIQYNSTVFLDSGDLLSEMIFLYFELRKWLPGLSNIMESIIKHLSRNRTVDRSPLILHSFLVMIDTLMKYNDEKFHGASWSLKNPISFRDIKISSEKNVRKKYLEELEKYFYEIFFTNTNLHVNFVINNIVVAIHNHTPDNTMLVSKILSIFITNFNNLNPTESNTKNSIINNHIESYLPSMILHELQELNMKSRKLADGLENYVCEHTRDKHCSCIIFWRIKEFSGEINCDKLFDIPLHRATMNFFQKNASNNRIMEHYFSYLHKIVILIPVLFKSVLKLITAYFQIQKTNCSGIFDPLLETNDPSGLNAFKRPKKLDDYFGRHAIDFTFTNIVLSDKITSDDVLYILMRFNSLFVVQCENQQRMARSEYTFFYRAQLFFIISYLSKKMMKFLQKGSSSPQSSLDPQSGLFGTNTLLLINNLNFFLEHYEVSDYFVVFDDILANRVVLLLKNMINSCLSKDVSQAISDIKSSSVRKSYLSMQDLGDIKSSDDPYKQEFISKSYLLIELLKYEMLKYSSLHQCSTDLREFEVDKRAIETYLSFLGNMNPKLVTFTVKRIDEFYLRSKLVSIISENVLSYIHIPSAVSLICDSENLKKSAKGYSELIYMAKIEPLLVMELFQDLTINFHPVFVNFSTNILRNTEPNRILDMVPQIIQLIRFDKLEYLKKMLVSLASKSSILCQLFLFNISSNLYRDELMKKKDACYDDFMALSETLKKNMSPNQQEFYRRESEFMNFLTQISKKLKNIKKKKPDNLAKAAFNDFVLPEKLFLPTDPNYIIVDYNREFIIPLKSAAKNPYLMEMKVKKIGLDNVEKYCTDPDFLLDLSKYETVKKRFIVKYGDDLRQDILCIQFMEQMLECFALYDFDLLTYPYQIVSTGQGEGIMECIPNAQSIHEILSKPSTPHSSYLSPAQSMQQPSLVSHLVKISSMTPGFSYEQAQFNYIRSLAYAEIFMYITLLKDRHNANLMVDKDGKMLHIDFGFILGKGPKVPEPALKYNLQLLNPITNTGSPYSKDSEGVALLYDYITRAFMGLKYYTRYFEYLIRGMSGSSMPCIDNGSPLNATTAFRKKVYTILKDQRVREKVEALMTSKYGELYKYDATQFMLNKTNY